MGEKLVTTIEQRRSGARVIKFSGILDEHSRLGELTKKVGTGTALLNLAGVERINSSGTRDWVNWLASLEANGTRPVLVACSPAVVAQLNRVKNFAGNAIVKSFQVPYHCEPCGLDKLLLVHVADMGAAPHKAPPCTCDGCSAPMTFSDESGDYFAFVGEAQRAKRPSQPEPEPTLARGSRSSVTTEHIARISKPALLRDSRPVLSVYQLPEGERVSDHDLTGPRMKQVDERPYLIAIVAIVAILLVALTVLVVLMLG